MTSSVTKRPDGNYAVEITGGPAFLVLTPIAMRNLIDAMEAAGIIDGPSSDRRI